MQLTTEDIGKVYALDPEHYYWVTDIQDTVRFREMKFVELTNTTYLGNVYFGKVLEKNIFGCIEKCEIRFCDDDILEESYSNKEYFNKDSIIYKLK